MPSRADKGESFPGVLPQARLAAGNLSLRCRLASRRLGEMRLCSLKLPWHVVKGFAAAVSKLGFAASSWSGSPMPNVRVLVVEDDTAMREVLEARLQGWRYEVATADCGARAAELLDAFDPHVVISDLVLPDVTGLELLAALTAEPRRHVFLITAYGTIDTAVEAMKRGARDFLTKPLDYVALKRLLDDAEGELGAESPVSAPGGLGRLVGGSNQQQRLYELIRMVAASDATSLIVGESGTGKELVAHTIHELSDRRNGPFVAVNSAAIPEGLTEGELFGHARGAFTGAIESRAGLFEQADGGTLFLDEITEMPLALQAKFLRVLEDRKVRPLGGRHERSCDVRILAATNRDPDLAVRDNLLRQDLYYRLNVFRIDVPALRERRSDIPALVEHFLRGLQSRRGGGVGRIEPTALRQLAAHSWPGNVRELRNVVERAVILASGGPIRVEQVPLEAPKAASEAPRGIVLPHRVTSAEAERILILETLRQSGNNKAEAARRLGLDVKTIRNKLKSFAARAE